MSISQFFNTYTWVIQVFFIIFVALILSYIETLVYRRVTPRLEKKNHFWQLAFMRALHAPIHVLIWVVGIFIAADISLSHAEDFAFCHILVPLRKVSIAALVVWFFIRLIKQFEQNLIDATHKNKRLDLTTVKAISQLLRVSILITASLIVLQTIGVPISGVVGFGAVSAAAVGFAAKDLLANFFGGFMIFLDRPFSIGDWVRSPDRNIEGVVENIGWRLTRIRTFDKRPLYVPNGIFSNISIENPSRMRNRRIKTTIGVRYDDAKLLPQIIEDIRAMIKEHPEIDTSQILMVNFVNFGPSSLDLMIYTFTKTTNWVHFQAVQEDVFFKALNIIASHGAQVAFPTQTLHIPEEIATKNS